ncbi:MAG: DnaA N-terminal domain-containing protein [Phreatobacter sp.]|uniref:DnaA N-terminal domain-containing protein n=1 Tax=Phreatobacter sp. TaxID=1966341 RepID=UPI0040361E6E
MSAAPELPLPAKVLIPKPMRMDWVDDMALDSDLSATAFRVACVIGTFFNSRSGDTFVSCETVAERMGKSARTVWAAIDELERAGYLAVERREHRPRSDDQARIAGGRGAKNHYRPVLKTSQKVATFKGGNPATSCEVSGAETSQLSAVNLATFRSRSLCNPVDINPRRARPAAHEAEPSVLGTAGERLRQSIGEAHFRSWFGRVEFEGASDGELRLSAPTAFVASRIRQDFAAPAIAAWRAEHPGIQTLAVAVRPDEARR